MNFVFFSTVLWDEAGGAHTPTQMARAVAQRGHSIFFIEPFASTDRIVGTLPIEVVALTELGQTMTQLKRAWYGLDAGSLETVAGNLQARLREFDGHDMARYAIWFAPFDPYVRLLPMLHARSYAPIYYAMDDFAAMHDAGYHRFNPRAEEYLAGQAQLLMTVSPSAAKNLRRAGRDACVIPNGINVDELRPLHSGHVEPPNVLRGEQTLGFWGTLTDGMIDAELLASVAQARPQWAINLLGEYDPEPERPSVAARLKDFKNIRLHGRVPHSQLMNYAAQFDVCLAPFPDNDLTRARSPIKLYEYLAAYKPIVAAHLPHVDSTPFVGNASTPSEFVEKIEQATRVNVDHRVVDEFLARQSWSSRAEIFLNAVATSVNGSTVPAQAKRASQVLPTFVEPNISALAAYSARLEKDLAETEVWARELEAVAEARARELQRIYNFLPMRMARRLLRNR